jgi:ATP synthase protein I
MPYHRPIPDENPRGKPSGLIGALIEAEKLIQIALILPCAAVVGWLIGAWIGSRLHHPWIALVGIAFGGFSGLVYVVRLALDTGKNPDFDAESGNETGKGNGSEPS